MQHTRFVIVAGSFLISAGICSCANPYKRQPSPEQLEEAERLNLYGPKPENHEEIVKNYIRRTFFDPYSVRDLQISPVEKAYWYKPGGLIINEKIWWGWRCVVTCNAKNRYGAYTGLKSAHYYIKNGVVEFVFPPY